jgi:hypothetical protein
MATETQIANLALGHLGVGKEIAILATEKSTEAGLCRRFYAQCRDETLRDFPWPFARTIRALDLVEEEPNDEWDFSYQYPSDCSFFRRILSGTRNDSRQTRVPYKIANSNQGRIIFTDIEDAQAEYTARIIDSSFYEPDFVSALSLLLASYIAPGLTAGDPFKLGQRALQLYAYARDKAQANATNEEQEEELPESEFIRGR